MRGSAFAHHSLAKVDFEFYFFDSICFRLPITKKKKAVQFSNSIFPFYLLVFSTFRIHDLLFILFISTSYLFFSSTWYFFYFDRLFRILDLVFIQLDSFTPFGRLFVFSISYFMMWIFCPQRNAIHVRNPCDIPATNRTENHTWFTRAILKLQLECDKNCIELPRQKSPV